jgi:hypothetical protein
MRNSKRRLDSDCFTNHNDNSDTKRVRPNHQEISHKTEVPIEQEFDLSIQDEYGQSSDQAVMYNSQTEASLKLWPTSCDGYDEYGAYECDDHSDNEFEYSFSSNSAPASYVCYDNETETPMEIGSSSFEPGNKRQRACLDLDKNNSSHDFSPELGFFLDDGLDLDDEVFEDNCRVFEKFKSAISQDSGIFDSYYGSECYTREGFDTFNSSTGFEIV